MKIVELLNAVRIPISNEEFELLNRFPDEKTEIAVHELSTREEHIADKLVRSDVLYRRRQNGKTVYSRKIRT